MPDREWIDPASGLRVLALSDGEALHSLRRRWEALARKAAAPNPFYEPFMLLPALRHLGARRVLAVAAVFGRSGRIASCAAPGDEAELLGLLPLELRSIGPAVGRLGLREALAWRHPYCFETSPLVARDAAEPVLAALRRWSARGRFGAAMLAMERVAGDTPVAAVLLRDAATGTRSACIRRTERALYIGPSQLEPVMSGKHAKEFRRLRRRLAEHGALAFRAAGPEDRIEDWIDAFVELERGGWKGRDGGAIGTSSATHTYFREAVGAGWRAGQVEMLSLELDGKPIAMKCNLIASTGRMFAFKIAYDERWARYSPGVLLELDAIGHWQAHGRDWVDSCAVPGHPMIDRLWTGRRAILEVSIGHGIVGRALVARLVRRQSKPSQTQPSFEAASERIA